MKKNKIASNIALVFAVGTLTACSATQTAIEHRNLEVKTQMSETIYLDPVTHGQKTVFISIKNTSDQNMDINERLRNALTVKGYKVVSNPSNAHYMLQGNILQVGKMSASASQSALGGGFGSVLAGAGTGVALGALTNNSNSMIAGGLAGGLVSMAADSLIKAVNYTMITDIQISEKVGKGVKVEEQFNASLKNGSASRVTQTSSKSSQYQRFRTRILSNADKVNLSFNEARPVLEQGLVKAVSGIF
jgi:hypothetical protein